MVLALATLTLVAAWLLLFLELEPVPSWFYVFAWYPTLVIADALVRRKGIRRNLFHEPASTMSLFGWSAIVWLLFEVANFRLRNWYYIFLPEADIERRVGILISFATVVPAVVLAERLLDSARVGRRWSVRPCATKPFDLWATQVLGLGMLTLTLLYPSTFFPLLWGAVWLLVDPIVYRRRPEWSLLGDLSQGDLGRIGRLALGGLNIGLLWEFLNFWARGKWVYTVPWLEGTKLFEMPPFGFLGFPFFALEAWALYHLLCVLGVAVPADRGRNGSAVSGVQSAECRVQGIEHAGQRPSSPNIAPYRLAVAIIFAAAFAGFTLVGMERWTISSLTPRVADLPGVSAADRRLVVDAGINSPFALAKIDPDALQARSESAGARMRQLVESSRLVVLRGIGTVHATRLESLGVSTVCALARRPPAVLWQEYHGEAGGRRRSHAVGVPGMDRPTPAEVRVWVGAARRECAGQWEFSPDN